MPDLTSPRTVLGAVLFGLTNMSLAIAAPLPSNRNMNIEMSNNDGALYDEGSNDTYFINAPGGGLNQLHISTDNTAAGVFGQVTSRQNHHVFGGGNLLGHD